MGLESVSMAASPICTIMGCRKDWKGFYGSVPHLYDNEAQGWDWKVSMAASPICTIMGCRKGWKGFHGSVPHLYDNRGKEEIQMYRCTDVQMSKCANVQMYQSPNVQMHQSAILGSPLTRSSAEW